MPRIEHHGGLTITRKLGQSIIIRYMNEEGKDSEIEIKLIQTQGRFARLAILGSREKWNVRREDHDGVELREYGEFDELGFIP